MPPCYTSSQANRHRSLKSCSFEGLGVGSKAPGLTLPHNLALSCKYNRVGLREPLVDIVAHHHHAGSFGSK